MRRILTAILAAGMLALFSSEPVQSQYISDGLFTPMEYDSTDIVHEADTVLGYECYGKQYPESSAVSCLSSHQVQQMEQRGFENESDRIRLSVKSAIVFQQGSKNHISVNQTGSGHVFQIRQRGTYNRVIIHQSN